MRRGMLRWTAILAAVGLAVLTASGGGAGLTTSDSTYASQGYLAAGWPNFDGAEQCYPGNTCLELEDHAFAQIDISDAMSNYETTAKFWVSNTLTDYTTLWFVCAYDGDGRTIECFYDYERDWGLMGELHPDTRELRLFPVHSAPNAYYLDLYVD